MSAEELGGRLLGEVKEETLDEVGFWTSLSENLILTYSSTKAPP